MNLDERGRRAAVALRERVSDDLPRADMLASVQRTRARRRLAVVGPAAALVVAVAATLTATTGHPSTSPTGPGPSSPTGGPTTQAHANGAVFGGGSWHWREPLGLVVPPIGPGSSPTWSPDGSHVAVLAGGIRITEVRSGQTRRLPCEGCSEIAWAPDGRTFAAAGVHGTALGLVDATTGHVTTVPLGGVHAVRSVTWAPGSDRVGFLVTSPVTSQGAYTAHRDGSHLLKIAPYPTTFGNDSRGLAVLLSLGWAPTRDRIAVLSASPTSRANGRFAGPYDVVVQDERPDGSGVNVLEHAGRCACVGFTPSLVWSPDGSTLGLSSLHRKAIVSRLDGDGETVSVRYLSGASGPLSWQPLPVGP